MVSFNFKLIFHGMKNGSKCSDVVSLNLLSARKPEKVDHIDAAGCIGDVVKAYTALYYQARVCGGETILIFNGASVSKKNKIKTNY